MPPPKYAPDSEVFADCEPTFAFEFRLKTINKSQIIFGLVFSRI